MVFSLVVMTGCNSIDDDSANCPQGLIVTLRVDGPDNNADDPNAIEDATIYAFDQDSCFLEKRQTQLNKPETFFYPHAGKMKFVGWCNTQTTNGGLVQVAPLVPEDSIALADVSMISRNVMRATGYYEYTPPTDLFLGWQTAQNTGHGQESVIVYATRRVGKMTITVRGLKLWYNNNDEDYSLLVATTKTVMDFDGVLKGDQCCIVPDASFPANPAVPGDYVTNLFNMMPSDEGMPLTVSLYKAGVWVRDATVDDEGNPIMTYANKTTNVLIVFTTSGAMSVTVEKSLWNTPYFWPKDFSQ